MAVKHEYRELTDIETKFSNTGKAPAQVNVAIEEIPPHRRGASLSRYQTSRNDWKTGIRERMPWWGLCAVLLALASSVGSFLVLHYSNEVSATRWPSFIAPNVCISILSSLSTIAITYAIGQGIAIAWWRCAMRGASVRELHSTWAFGTSIMAIFTEFKFFNAIALASLMAKLSIVDGVLFQRATSTYISIDWSNRVPVNIAAFSQESFPVTAVMGSNNDNNFYLTNTFGIAVRNWILNGRQPIDDETSGCEGVACEYFLPGAGFAVDCESTNTTNKFLESTPGTNVTALALFSIDLDIRHPDNTKNYSRLDLSMMFPATQTQSDTVPACPTEFTQVTCELRPAVLNYSTWFMQPNNIEQSRLVEVLKAEQDEVKGKLPSIRARRYQVTLSYPGSLLGSGCLSIPANWAGDQEEFATDAQQDCLQYDPKIRQARGTTVIENRDIHEPWEMGANSSLLGIHQTLKDRLRSLATMSYHDKRWYVNTTGWLASVHSSGTIPTDGSCNISFRDPMFDVLSEINTFTRQLSVDATLYESDTNRNRNATGAQYFRDFYHLTDYTFAYAALACTVLVVLCVLPAFYGFWQLGRDVTMGPLEVAYAFQGPAFAGITDTNGNVDTLVKAAGNTRIKYAEIHDGTATKLAFKVSRYSLPE